MAVIFTACQAKNEKITMATIDSLRKYGDTVQVSTTARDSSLVVFYDTIFPPAGDQGSRTFFHINDRLIYTGQTISQKPTLSKGIVMAYFYHNDPDTSATLTNMYAFPYDTDKWKKSMTHFRKGISEEAYQLSNTNSDLSTAFHRSLHPDSAQGAAYKLAPNDIIAFKTEQNKYGLIKIKHVEPGNNPYKNFLTFEMKVQR
ncbi:MAG: hypothetical protein ACJ75J_11915 [Cytophagaceae bacterium]